MPHRPAARSEDLLKAAGFVCMLLSKAVKNLGATIPTTSTSLKTTIGKSCEVSLVPKKSDAYTSGSFSPIAWNSVRNRC